MKYPLLVALLLFSLVLSNSLRSEEITVRPTESDEVLVNPGIGFTSFERFKTDPLDFGVDSKKHPESSIAYYRIYWKLLEPEQGKYDWTFLDTALKQASEHQQSIMLRVAPHAYVREYDRDTDDEQKPNPLTDAITKKRKSDVPAWYRKLVGNDYLKLKEKKWSIDPEDPRYAKNFGKMIRELGKRYDGHPDLGSVDLAIVGAWGEGAGADKLTDETVRALCDPYLESFKKTPMMAMLMDERTNKYIMSKGNVGWRADCLGDLGGFSPHWSHMHDFYPQAVANNGIADAWKKAPVGFEVCWTMYKWQREKWDLNYIIEQSLKWHISTLNAKSAGVPDEYRPAVDRWLKKMGYRFVLNKFIFDNEVQIGKKLKLSSSWTNRGVAPIYRNYPLALRLTGKDKLGLETVKILKTTADIRTWLPGDVKFNDELTIPEMLSGDYQLSLAIIDPTTELPKVKLAIKETDANDWLPLGKITISEK